MPLEYLTERLFVLPDRALGMAVVLPSAEHYKVISASSDAAEESLRPQILAAAAAAAAEHARLRPSSTQPHAGAVLPPVPVPPTSSAPSVGLIEVALCNSYRASASAQEFLQGCAQQRLPSLPACLDAPVLISVWVSISHRPDGTLALVNIRGPRHKPAYAWYDWTFRPTACSAFHQGLAAQNAQQQLCELALQDTCLRCLSSLP